MNYEVGCKHCGRHFGYARGTVLLEGFICTNTACKARLNIKIVTSDSTDAEVRYKFTSEEVAPKPKSTS